MATLESIREAGKKKREAEERNPLLKLNLGELVMEMQRIASADITVLMTPEDKIEDVPEHRLEDFKKYHAIVKELNRREEEYKSYKPDQRY